MVGNESGDDHDGHGLIVLKRHSYVRAFTSTISGTVTDKPQEGLGKIHAINTDGETVIQIEGLGQTGSNVVLGRDCLISLNWPAAT